MTRHTLKYHEGDCGTDGEDSEDEEMPLEGESRRIEEGRTRKGRLEWMVIEERQSILPGRT